MPLCRELRTEAGPADAVFINEHGRLTIVECKKWRNPQARREVVAQALDYVAAISRWSYSDLQRQVSAATGLQGNVPFEIAQRFAGGRLNEQEFVDSASRALEQGRFLVLVVGDGIREGLESLAELVTRNSTKAFSFGLVEVALHIFPDEQLVIQPRVLLKTELVERTFNLITVDGKWANATANVGDAIEDFDPGSGGGTKLHLKEWWKPLLQMTFDDPEQEPPSWVGTNNLLLNTPFPGIRIKAWAQVGSKNAEVFVSGTRSANIDSIADFIERDHDYLVENLPQGTIVDSKQSWPIRVRKDDFPTDEERRHWLRVTLNRFVNVLRPRMRAWRDDY